VACVPPANDREVRGIAAKKQRATLAALPVGLVRRPVPMPTQGHQKASGRYFSSPAGIGATRPCRSLPGRPYCLAPTAMNPSDFAAFKPMTSMRRVSLS
jgi:hypothetical protein